MRRAAFLILSVGAILIIVAISMTQSLLILQRVAAVRDVQGYVWVQSRGQGEFKPLAGAERVAAGDVVRTGPKAGLTLNWLDGTRMRLGENTVVTVLKCQINTATKAETSLFKLDLGRVWIRVLKVLSHKSKFEVKTPTATAGVRGTVFSVAVTPQGETLVSVKEGEVAVQTAEQAAAVKPGQMAQATAQGAQLEAQSADETALWQEHAGVALPQLELTAPTTGSTVAAGETLEVAGQAEVGASVTVNGQVVPVLLAGRFRGKYTVPADARGTCAVVVVARDARGYESTARVDLKVR